jgi:Flp pilus assembly protein TadB
VEDPAKQEREREKETKESSKKETKEQRESRKEREKESKERVKKKETKREKKKKKKRLSTAAADPAAHASDMEVVVTPHIPAIAVAAAAVVPPVSAIQENVNALLTAPWGFGINNQAVPFPPMLDRFMLHLPLLGGHAALTCTSPPRNPYDFDLFYF